MDSRTPYKGWPDYPYWPGVVDIGGGPATPKGQQIIIIIFLGWALGVVRPPPRANKLLIFFLVWAFGVAGQTSHRWLRPPQTGQSRVAEATRRPMMVVQPV